MNLATMLVIITVSPIWTVEFIRWYLCLFHRCATNLTFLISCDLSFINILPLSVVVTCQFPFSNYQ